VTPSTKQTAEFAAEPRPAENGFRARKADDGFDREEIRRIAQALDEIEFVPQLCRYVIGQGSGIALGRAFPGQLFQTFLRGEAVLKLFRRIGVGQVIEREAAPFGDFPGSPDRTDQARFGFVSAPTTSVRPRAIRRKNWL
jgi:hypothetical protein